MKKFLTLIAFTSTLVPAIHGMETSLSEVLRKKVFTFLAFNGVLVPAPDSSADIQNEQYKLITEGLKSLIQDADTDEQSFKNFFDTWHLPISCLIEIEQVVFETKNKISSELNAKDCKNKNWSKIAKGALSTVVAGWSCVAAPALFYDVQMKKPVVIHINERINLLNAPFTLPFALSVAAGNVIGDTGSALLLVTLPISYTAFLMSSSIYGIKNIKSGLNYKQHLQDKLTNLDAIAAHIAHAKEQVAHA